ncbi:MAG TPA: transketolase [Elusimicrobiota bacterium]|nr:transketolase [Elusimicrobiota bacterium]
MTTATAPKTDLKKTAAQLRIAVIRMIEAASSGHPGGSLSIIDILLYLYTQVLRHDAKKPAWPDRDRLILSKGHACPALYAVMAHCGYFPESELMTLRKLGSRLQGHPDRLRLPGIEASTGSLGQGLSIALGMALAGLMDKKDYRVYAILGDGEMQEGQVWEALMAAPKFKTANLTVIIDSNNGQIDGHVAEIMSLDPLADKLASFGWNVKAIDGHDFGAIGGAFAADRTAVGKPRAVIAHTIKGKGVSFMENQIAWHGKAPNKEEADKAVAELTKGLS